MRQTVSSLGTEEADEVPPLLEPEPEPQAVTASAAAAQIATAVILCRTAGVLLARLQWYVPEKLIGKFLIS
jgi:hypothetical protein